jgi:hypothetical protein
MSQYKLHSATKSRPNGTATGLNELFCKSGQRASHSILAFLKDCVCLLVAPFAALNTWRTLLFNSLRRVWFACVLIACGFVERSDFSLWQKYHAEASYFLQFAVNSLLQEENVIKNRAGLRRIKRTEEENLSVQLTTCIDPLKILLRQKKHLTCL